MKKWIYVLLASFLMLLYLPASVAMADARGTLTADSKKENITVTLQKPEGVTDSVTSLRFWMYVSVSEGSTKQPLFQFSDAFRAADNIVSSAAVTKQGSMYVADIVVAVKDQDIFKNGGKAVIGTLTLQPSETFRAKTGLAGRAGATASQPVLIYVSSRVQSAQSVQITDAKTVECIKINGSADPNPAGPQDPVVPNLPVTPQLPSVPGQPVTPDQGVTQPDTDTDQPQTEEPGSSSGSGNGNKQKFDTKKALSLKLSAKNGSARITFRWSRAAGADGYQIYQYDLDTGKSKQLKTILNPDKTSYSKELEYGTAYSFRVRAFQTGKNNKRTYGRFSRVMHTVTAPAKVTGVSVKRQKSSDIAVSWKLKGAADGFQIYRSTARNGKYTRLKTISKGSTKKYTGISQKNGQTCYYKVRAYASGTDGKRIYGKFSSVKKL